MSVDLLNVIWCRSYFHVCLVFNNLPISWLSRYGAWTQRWLSVIESKAVAMTVWYCVNATYTGWPTKYASTEYCHQVVPASWARFWV